MTHLTKVWSANSVWCRVTHVVTTYFTMTNYAWMLCEGAFLHFLLVLPFLEEEILIKHLWRFGWLCPLLFVLPYAIYRAIYEVNHIRDSVNFSVDFYFLQFFLFILRTIIVGWTKVTATGSLEFPWSLSSSWTSTSWPGSWLFKEQSWSKLIFY